MTETSPPGRGNRTTGKTRTGGKPSGRTCGSWD
jgi:hypothetical protein